MPSQRTRFLLVGLGLVAVSFPAAAQTIEPGTWTGTVTPPADETVNVTFVVEVSGDTTRITVRSDFGDFEFSDIKVETDRLTFTFSPGPVVRCELLLREDKSYAGDCIDPDGDAGVMVMIPPGGGGGRARETDIG